MKKIAAAFIAFMLMTGAAVAAEIAPTYSKSSSSGEIQWNQINNNDTAGEAQINSPNNERGILYKFFINGTPANVDLKLQSGKTSGALKDIDTDAMPDGVRFNSASTYSTLVCLSVGEYVDIAFSSAGGSTQDIDVYLSPLGGCQ